MTIDLTGTWEGHYLQDGGRHGISMRIVQRGQSFVGRMRDFDTVLAGTEMLPPRTAPDSGAQPAEVLSTLPEHSAIEGEIDGRMVSFVKTYQGKSTVSVFVPGTASMSFERPGHQVHYLGTLDPDGALLTGHWCIKDGGQGRRLRDRFELRRALS